MKIADRVKQQTTTTGTGTYTLSGSVAGFRSFTSAFSNLDVVEYAVTDGTDWEVGYGTFTTSGTTLARSTIRASSNSGSPVSWSAGTKEIWCNASAGFVDVLPSDTVMLFVQTSAPTGWTKSVTHNDKALRVVSGTASSGGSVAFTTAFASKTPAGTVSGTVGNSALSIAQLAAHPHSVPSYSGGSGTNATSLAQGSDTPSGTVSSNNNGSGSVHGHSWSGSFSGTAINLAVQYVDVIIATRN